jgi:hypothetical protein
LLLVVVASGCGNRIEREYVWTRATPAIARRSPTTFVVRLRVDPEKRSVVWFEDVHDSDGDLGRTSKTWSDCTFLDDSNWECKTGVVLGQVIPDDIEMKDGKLRQGYWGEQRDFTLRRKIFGVSF